MLDTLIIGGGIHGTHLSLYLTQRLRISHDRLRVLDPYEAPLARWDATVANVGMEFLRSSHAHNLSHDPFSLATFARTRQGELLARFTDPFGRPSVELFRAHSQRLIERNRLDSLRITGRAHGLARIEGGWRVEMGDGSLEARRVILAISLTEQPYWPEWARDLPGAHHIFDLDFKRESLTTWQHAVVVGGGITAAQTAMTMAAQQPGTVTLLTRHPLRLHAFDSDPCWVTSLCLKALHAETVYGQRRAMIQAARHRVSLPPDVAHSLQQAALSGVLHRRLAEVTSASLAAGVAPPLHRMGSGGEVIAATETEIRLHLDDDSTLNADVVILATGFESARPGGVWLDEAIAANNLPVASDGYPVVDKTLQWGDGLFVAGPLAELEIGPTARNIIGARLASERIGSN